MQSRYEKKLEKAKTVTMHDIGEKFGRASSDLNNWWKETTKPVTDAVDEFKAGYNSSR